MRHLARALMLLFALTACGQSTPSVTPHGFVLEPWPEVDPGEPVRVGGQLEPGVHVADVRMTWKARPRRGGSREASARLRIVQEITALETGWRSHVGVEVAEREGETDLYIRGIDGLEIDVDHDAAGRPLPLTLKFGARAPPGARAFFEGLELAGIAGSPAWVPRGQIRAGETWSRARLAGRPRPPPTVRNAVVPEFSATGGGHLERTSMTAEGRLLHVSLRTLVEVEGPVRRALESGAVSIGVLRTGTATLKAGSALPVDWVFEEHSRVFWDIGGESNEVELRMSVEGRCRLQPPDDR